MGQNRMRPGRIHIPHWILHASHVLATGLALAMIATLALDQEFSWLRHRPGGDAFDLNEQPVFMALFAVGALVALRWKLVGGTIAVFTAGGLVVFAGRQLVLTDAVLVFVGFLIPAVLWLVVGLFELRDEQFHRAPDEHPRPLLRRRDVLGGLAILGVATVGGVRVGQWLFDRIYGPTHPSSVVSAVSGSPVKWLWCGAVTTDSAVVTTRLENDDSTVSMEVSTAPTMTNPSTVPAAADDEGFVRVQLDGLEADSTYHYAFVVDGEPDRKRIGTFRTHPSGAATFTVVVASCARTGSNGAVFDTIRTLDPQMVIIDGDMHYGDIARNDQDAFRQIMDHTLGQPAQAAMFQRCPVGYVWDDHDYGGADSASDSRPAAMATYREYVPHYSLAASESPLYQAFTIGRVRFVLTDARSGRAPGEGQTPGSMLGAAQKEWLKSQLAAGNRDHELLVWVNPVPWIAASKAEGNGDDWGAYASERAELADFIAADGLHESLLMVSGDAHMVAIDDGANSDFSSVAAGGFPVLHAAALDRPGSSKGGPYSHGAFPGGGQFGVITVTDEGGELTVDISGRNWRNDILVEHRFEAGQG
ncbi:MAG: alkaline phosphatase D family protein [Acidimicrobiales bacterium]